MSEGWVCDVSGSTVGTIEKLPGFPPCSCQGCRAAQAVSNLEDKVEGLEADLDSAVRVAFLRGADEWVALNYPDLHRRLESTT